MVIGVFCNYLKTIGKMDNFEVFKKTSRFRPEQP